ncbi:MAG TPA: FecR domain-containing protein, partial [Dongiaceae bacterium]|nr:FecR domain-containing protein [Dongiaceae bacterium]
MRSSLRPANRTVVASFWRRWLGPAVLAAAVSAAGGAHADDGVLTWIVKSISSDDDGDVIPVSAMQVPQVGTRLVTGQRISTGAGQHMVLVHGRDLVEIKANSTVTIGDDDLSTLDANVQLINGTIHVEVGKRAPGTTFSIDAPYLIATVKGTQFDVSSSSAQSAVTVTEGVVAVSADTSGASVDVTIGKTAIVRRGADRPTMAATKASGTPSTIEVDKNVESASTDDAGGSKSDGSNSGGSNSGGSNSGGSNSGGSDSGGSDSGGSDSGGSDSGG